MTRSLLRLSLCAAAIFAVALPALAQSNSVQFFSNTNIPQGQPVGNAVCFFCNVDVQAEVNGNLVVFFGHARTASAVHGNVVTFFGNTTVQPSVTVDQNVVNFFGRTRIEDSAHVGGNMVSMFGDAEIAPTAIISGNHVLFSFWLFLGPVLLLAAALYIILHELRQRRYRAYPPPPGVRF